MGLNVSGVQFGNLSQIDVQTQAGCSRLDQDHRPGDQRYHQSARQVRHFQANTLESTANNLRASLENTTAAESTIRDTDFAAETAAFTKNQVLIQAGTSVLQNANQTSQLVLALLKG